MKEKIQYYYNMIPKNLIYRAEYIEFTSNNDHYYLMLENGKFQQAMLIDKIMKLNKIDIYDFIVNKNFQYITLINNKGYVLLKLLVEKTEKEIDLNDLLLFANLTLNFTSELRWIDKWIQKTDALESNRSELLSKNETLEKTLDYYLGISENAIMYVKYHSTNIGKIYQLHLQHERLNTKTRKYIMFYNPFYIIFDIRVRDISELIKQYILEGKNYKKLLKEIIEIMKINSNEIGLIVSRIMFPTYYFDFIEDENSFANKKIITFSSYYLDTMNEIIKLVSSYYEIPMPDYLHQ